MTRADRITGAVLLSFAVAFGGGALVYYPYSSEGGPGSGFLPFWLSLAMAALSLVLLARRPRPAGEAPALMPRGEGARRVLAVLGATIAFVAALKVLGMILGAALYLAFLMRYLGRHAWWLVVLVSAAAAGLDWLVFAHWLRVPFPGGMLWTF